MNDESKMTFFEHLEELRRRLIICVLSVLAGMIICWFFRDAILSFLLAPLYEAWRQVDGLAEPQPLNFTDMLEPFVAYLKLSAIGGIFLSAPVVLYQLWKFISPGLYAKEKRLAVPFVLASTLLFVGGSTMAYSMVFPIGFRFFLEFAAGQEMTASEGEIVVNESPPELPPEITASPSDARDIDAGPDDSDTSVDKETGLVAENKDSIEPRAEPVAALPGKEPAPSPKDESKPHWVVSLLNLIFNDDCGELSIGQTENRLGAKLSIKWHRARCGPLPEQIRVRRDGEVIHPKWESVDSDGIDIERFIATDFPHNPGAHTYVLKAPKNPSAHRLVPVLMVKDYLSLAIRMLLAFGVVFELPIFISFLAIAGIVNYRQLIRFFRYFVVLAFIIGAVLTPPDAVSQCLLSIPLVVLYALSIVVAYFFGEKPVD